MAETHVAVFIVSADFLNSEFVRRKEIPALLERRRREGLRIIPLIARPCPWQQVPWLAAIQARPLDGKTLASLSRVKAEQVLSDLAEEILRLAAPPAASPPGDPAWGITGARPQRQEAEVKAREVRDEKLRVFLCHAAADKTPVRDLYRRLKAQAFDPWLDEERLLPGQDWEREIRKQVRAADAVVCCLSKNSITWEGFVQREIRYALDVADEKPEGTIYLIPVRLEECEVPERLRRWQWVDLFEERGYSRLVQSLEIRGDELGRRKPEASLASRSHKDLLPLWTSEQSALHYRAIRLAVTKGKMVVVLGPETNLCGRPAGVRWKPLQLDYAPSRSDLAAYLAEVSAYPSGEGQELMQVSQYFADKRGRVALDKVLDSVLYVDYSPTPVHRFLAQLSAVFHDRNRASKSSMSWLVIITVNYDDVLERTFARSGSAFHLLTFDRASDRDNVTHQLPTGERRTIEGPEGYTFFFDDGLPVIVKIAGGVNNVSPDLGRYMITEDDQNAFLVRSPISKLLPAALSAMVQRAPMLFLGCGPRHWNRPASVDLVFDASRRDKQYGSWAIQLTPYVLDQSFWIKRKIEFVPVGLEEYIGAMSVRVISE